MPSTASFGTVASWNSDLRQKDRPVQVAILGGGGIGAVHARIFQECGAEITAVLGSSVESAGEACSQLNATCGVDAQPFGVLTTLLKKLKPDAVSICTPAKRHLEQILEALDHNVAVFCEKPLFWSDGILRQEIAAGIRRIEEHPNRHVMVNTSNTYLLEAALAHWNPGPPRESFRFCFHTLGSYRQREIPADLLPHALSLLIALCGEHSVENLAESSAGHVWSARFRYAGTAVEFLFQEDPQGERELWFELDDERFTRIQEGTGAGYRVYLEDKSGHRLEVEDPFRRAIGKFLTGYESWEQDASNLHLMAEFLL